MLFLGCDSGSTKMAFALCDTQGRVLAARSFPGITLFRNRGSEYAALLTGYAHALLADAGIAASAITMGALGLTGYGESAEAEPVMREAVSAAFPGMPMILVNDAVVGWSGALQARPGIHVVAGTGAIAYGEDGKGGKARCGGWSTFCDDEGSAYWIAREGLNLFYRQADRRIPKTALYDRWMQALQITDPLHAPGAFDALTGGWQPARVAAFQRLMLTLCQEGDPCAEQVYAQAADHLFHLVSTLAHTLCFAEKSIPVSYSGGVFRGKGLLLDRFSAHCAQAGLHLCAPAFGPLAGSIGYAARDSVDASVLSHMMECVDKTPVV